MTQAAHRSGWFHGAAALVLCLLCGGCYRGTKLVSVTFTDRDGSSEYWVCPARDGKRAAPCRGRLDGDVEDTDYDPNLDVLAPPAECPDGVARMELVVRRHRVLRVGYECALPRAPTGLPPSAPAEAGLPPEPAADAGATSPASEPSP